MIRQYYSSRKQPGNLTLEDLYAKLRSLFLFFRDKNYFKGKAGITQTEFPQAIIHKAAIALTFQPFPMTDTKGWLRQDLTEDHVFDTLEFLYDHVSRPGEVVPMTSETGFNYYDHDGYDDSLGRAEFQLMANSFLSGYRSGYELSDSGIILALGADGLRQILDADIPPYDEINVDSKVRNAITKWRNRHLSFEAKKEAIRELADVFEWLKKTRGLSAALDGKDESAIFDLANNFAIRHHNPKQKTNYDPAIWYSWMFHFYLATYHASIRLLIKHEKSKRASVAESKTRT